MLHACIYFCCKRLLTDFSGKHLSSFCSLDIVAVRGQSAYCETFSKTRPWHHTLLILVYKQYKCDSKGHAKSR